MAERTAFETVCRRTGVTIPDLHFPPTSSFNGSVTDNISTLLINPEDFVACITYNGSKYYGVGSRKQLAINKLFARLMGSNYVVKVKGKESMLTTCREMGITCKISYEAEGEHTSVVVDLSYRGSLVFCFALEDVKFHNTIHEATQIFNASREHIELTLDTIKAALNEPVDLSKPAI
nr:hypothetical protein [Beihai hepe-like virus 4]